MELNEMNKEIARISNGSCEGSFKDDRIHKLSKMSNENLIDYFWAISSRSAIDFFIMQPDSYTRETCIYAKKELLKRLEYEWEE